MYTPYIYKGWGMVAANFYEIRYMEMLFKL